MNHFIPTNNELIDKIILVTGSSRGIGRQISITYAKFGACVLLLARDETKLNAVYDEIIDLGCKHKPVIVPFDLENDSVQNYVELANFIESEFQKLDGIVLNAGILTKRTTVEQLSLKSLQKSMQINVYSSILLLQHLMYVLSQTEDSSVIFTSSSVANNPRAYWADYGISKNASDYLMQLFAIEHIGNVRFNAINPGATDTDMRDISYPFEDKTAIKKPHEIMHTYLYLMSSASKNINGKIVNAQ